MDTERNLLFGAFALQTGLIDSHQFTESCQHWRARPDTSFQDVLLERGYIAPIDTLHLEHLLQRALDKHPGNAKAILAALPSVVRKSLAALEALDYGRTVAGSPSPPGSGPPSTPIGDPSVETRYAFLSLHATGGMGRVWLARDRHLDREVAIKELLPEQAGKAKVAARFLREARLTGQLEHPGIVPVYELASRADTDQPFYAMRLVRGRTLTSAIDAYHAQRAEGRAEPLDFVGLLTAFAAVGNTIAYAHSRGVLHRDLKGDNVILGDFGEVIVLDWGLAKLMSEPDEEADPFRADADGAQDPALTVQGEIMGTPAYMAPEQAEGRLDQIDHRTDIYGLGAILYEILTGQPPFVGSSTLEVLQKAARSSPTPPREVWSEVPPALEEVCLKAMAKAPDKRYASASDLAQEVQRWQDVQRRQAEDALRRQTEVLRSILNGMSEGVFVADADGNLILINPAAERMIGRPSEATLAATRRTSKFYRPDTVTPLDTQDLPSARAIRGEEVDDAEMFLRPVHTGKGIWVSANARPLRDQSGSVRGSVVVFRDVTARKRAEEALRESEHQFHTLANSIPQLAWMADAAGSIFWYNQRWYDYTGTTLEGMQGWGWQKVHHPEEVGRVVERIQRAFATGEPWEDTFPLRSKEGEYRWFLSRALPIRDADGRVVRWFGTNTDVTEQRQARAEAEAAVRVLEGAQEALHASEEKYRSLADLIPGIVWTARPDGWIDYANQFWLNFTGMTLEQTVGSGWTAMLHPEDTERVFQLWTKSLQTGEPIEVDYRLKRAADGVYRWFLAQSRPLRDREGRIVKWFGMLTEIEDQKQGEKALERQVALVRLLHQVTVAAYEAATVEEAMQVGIDQVCAYTGWPIGHVYVLAGAGSQELVPTTIWHLDRPGDFESFVQVTEATRLAAGAGLPGRVLAGKEPHWIMDVTRDDNFPRAKAAADLGVKGAFAFPVLTGAGVVAVLEFFTSEPKEPDEVLLRAMAQIGLQLGQVFERKRAETELQESKEAANRVRSESISRMSLERRTPNLQADIQDDRA